MKKFIIQVLGTIVGILLLGGLLITIIIIWGVSSSSSSNPNLKDNSVLEIKLDGNILESPNQKDPFNFSQSEESSLYLKDILDLINHAKTDKKIKGISLKISNLEAGYAEITEIRNALEEFKKNNKFIYSYNNDSSQKNYYLSSVADSLFLNPNASVELIGMSTQIIFYKNLGDKYGINFDVIRHGKYKSAVEPFMRDDLSEENRFQLKELLTNIWGKISEDISKSRKISVDRINLIADSLYGFIPELAFKNKLVDRLVYESQYDDLIKKKIGIKGEEDNRKISLSDYKSVAQLDSGSKDQIAILYASGNIYTGKGDDGIYSQTIIKQIKDIEKNDKIKAVVLRINSGGGSANASAEILNELYRLKSKKPLIVSFSDVAASGGYYIAMAADRIYAQETTITGSVGVLSMLPNVKKLANNIGVTADYVSTNANSMYYSMINGATEDMKTMTKKSIESIYGKFVSVVMKGRKMTFAQVDNLGGGRVWSGKEALVNGLIDEIGTFNDAVLYAAKKANIKEYSIISYPKEKSTYELILDKIGKSDEAKAKIANDLLKQELGKEGYDLYRKIKNIENEKGILYRIPFDLSIK